MKASDKKPVYDDYMTLAEYTSKEKTKALQVLPKGKLVESKRKKEGYVWMTSPDGKTNVQTKRVEFYKKLGYIKKN